MDCKIPLSLLISITYNDWRLHYPEHAMTSRFFPVLILAALLGACSDDDNANQNCNDTLTVDLVNREIQTEILFSSDGVSLSGTTLVHDDGNQGNSSVDLLRLVLARASHQDGDTMLIAYSARNTTAVPSNTFVALYIDTDNNLATGYPVNGIGADSLFLDDGRAFGSESSSYGHYHTWSVSGWTAHGTLGSLSSLGSYFEGCTEMIGMYLPLSQGVADLYNISNEVKGVMKVVTLSSGNPNIVLSEIDSTAMFTFNLP
jgi:hypothetical protein